MEFFLYKYNVYEIAFWSVDLRTWYPLSDDLSGWCTIEDEESKNFFTATQEISQIIFSQFLHSLNFVEMEFKVKI